MCVEMASLIHWFLKGIEKCISTSCNVFIQLFDCFVSILFGLSLFFILLKGFIKSSSVVIFWNRSCAGRRAGDGCVVCQSPAWVKDLQINRHLSNITQLFCSLESLLSPTVTTGKRSNAPSHTFSITITFFF